MHTWTGLSKATFALLVSFSFAIRMAPAMALEKGEMAPDFELSAANGNVSLAQYRGKIIYLDFWASWCGPCKQSFPWMNAMQAKYAVKGLQIVSINVDAKRDDATKFLLTNPATFAVGFDPKGLTPAQYAVKAMPSSYLIGRDGRITFLHRGYAAEDGAKLEQEIRLALERQP